MMTKREANAKECTLQSVRICYWHIWGNNLRGQEAGRVTIDHAAKWQRLGLTKAPATVSVACGGEAQGLGPAARGRLAQTAHLMGGNGVVCTWALGEGEDCLLGLQMQLPSERNGTVQFWQI